VFLFLGMVLYPVEAKHYVTASGEVIRVNQVTSDSGMLKDGKSYTYRLVDNDGKQLALLTYSIKKSTYRDQPCYRIEYKEVYSSGEEKTCYSYINESTLELLYQNRSTPAAEGSSVMEISIDPLNKELTITSRYKDLSMIKTLKTEKEVVIDDINLYIVISGLLDDLSTTPLKCKYLWGPSLYIGLLDMEITGKGKEEIYADNKSYMCRRVQIDIASKIPNYEFEIKHIAWYNENNILMKVSLQGGGTIEYVSAQ